MKPNGSLMCQLFTYASITLWIGCISFCFLRTYDVTDLLFFVCLGHIRSPYEAPVDGFCTISVWVIECSCVCVGNNTNDAYVNLNFLTSSYIFAMVVLCESWRPRWLIHEFSVRVTLIVSLIFVRSCPLRDLCKMFCSSTLIPWLQHTECLYPSDV